MLLDEVTKKKEKKFYKSEEKNFKKERKNMFFSSENWRHLPGFR
jgi:hypothetical protein